MPGGGRVRALSNPATGPIDVTSEELARAARLLAVRSHREATGLFAGNYASAFRGGGLEFEESRPYVAGDDVRTIDWIATARTGEPFVKRYREERNLTLLFALDTSASMRFGTAGHTKAAAAAHALALMAAAAGRAGDRTGLLVFDREIRAEVAVGRGLAHTWRLIRAAVEAAATPAGKTRIAVGLRGLLADTRRRASVVLLSDFRDPRLLPGDGVSADRELADSEFGGPEFGNWELRRALSGLARRCDVAAAVVFDPREERLPSAGPVRVADPERPGATFVLDTGSRRARDRYRAACAVRRSRLNRALRRSGVEPLWLRSDQSPLYALGRFFQQRATRRGRVAA
jgi:uncharacterized protein (DUF58 family)